MNANRAEPNDDPELDPVELEDAVNEEPALSAPELTPSTADLTAWDEVPGATGEAAPKVTPEDEVNAAEQLVAEGIEEADREQRLAAADPDFEP
ncbi:MAG: hypothetical protein QOE70_42 [Chthoniobacter sp.]|jgi:hypothetical protein|nr:hypothetical protein [Chthoniobacter sp.]